MPPDDNTPQNDANDAKTIAEKLNEITVALAAATEALAALGEQLFPSPTGDQNDNPKTEGDTGEEKEKEESGEGGDGGEDNEKGEDDKAAE